MPEMIKTLGLVVVCALGWSEKVKGLELELVVVTKRCLVAWVKNLEFFEFL